MNVDLDELESVTREMDIGCGPSHTLALIKRIREFQAFVAATPDKVLRVDKVFRDGFPGLFTDDDGTALYMDEAKRRILAKGVVLP